MAASLESKFFNHSARSPLVLASGILGVSYSGMLQAVEHECGIVTTKSVTLEPRKGHDGPVIAEFKGGMINSMGLSNPGIESLLREVEDFKSRSSAPVIISIFAVDAEGFCKLADYCNQSPADAVELNLSCPNVADEFGTPLAASVEKVKEIVGAVHAVSTLPVFAKLSPNTYNVSEIAVSAEQAGASGLTLINTIGPGMMIDIHARQPVIHSVYGGVSGYAIKPIALKLVHEISGKIHIPIIGTGGITCWQDAVEFRMAGASWCGIGTAVYYEGMKVFRQIANGLRRYLDEQGLQYFTDIERI